MPKRKNILPQMFDVKPTRKDGSLDIEKIRDLGQNKILKLYSSAEIRQARRGVQLKEIRRSDEIIFAVGKKTVARQKLSSSSEEKNDWKQCRRPNAIQMGNIMPDAPISVSKIYVPEIFSDRKLHLKPTEISDSFFWPDDSHFEEKSSIYQFTSNEAQSGNSLIPTSEDFFLPPADRKKKTDRKSRKKSIRSLFSHNLSTLYSKNETPALAGTFAAVLLLFSFSIPCFSFIEKSFEKKAALVNSSSVALANFALAKDNFVNGNFETAATNFDQSHEILLGASNDLAEIGGKFSDILRYVPGASQIATANYLVIAGRDVASAGKEISDTLKVLYEVDNPLAGKSNQSLADIFLSIKDGISEATDMLSSANKNISKANVDDLPPAMQPKFLELKEKLPLVLASLGNFTDDSDIILDLLGHNGPRKFLFLLQNNQELRATGGFIGSYGILDVSDGRIKKMFVDDIYNPDGQLKARVIPPEPIQKMSAVWTMHDANWFPNFPTSAEKVAWFYEKTGGPTVDGVIAMTPTVIQKLLSITGPIDMPEYETTIDESNFIEKTQFEVELDYDKEKNEPKKFIADLTPKVLDRVFNTRETAAMMQILNVFNSALKEKQLIVYLKNYNVQKLVSEEGWSGEVLNTDKDYLSVINSNINGYKTDGVIDETIEHTADISSDGSIVDEVTITRHHKGGNEKYDWWNKVNGDYIRVYVPERSELLEVSGQTREFVSPPLDYELLGFRKDPQLAQLDDTLKTDEDSGTRIYSENRKTVFANWIYVSPGETVQLKYKYRLPFKMSFDPLHHPADSFSVLYQKQSGSLGSKLLSFVKIPTEMKTIWRWPENATQENNDLRYETTLDVDRFVGLTLEKN